MTRICLITVCLFISLFISLSISDTDQNDPEIYQAQKILKDLGYKPGPIDGILGKPTQRAFEKYQRNNRLPVTGWLDEKTKAELGISTLGRSIRQKGQTRERRIAVVIGNGDYKFAPLRNPVNDAYDMAAMLKKLDFEVL